MDFLYRPIKTEAWDMQLYDLAKPYIVMFV